jgi:quercetin dioxygenase-like cupin family protein
MKTAAFTAALLLCLAAPAIAQAPESVALGQADKTNSGQAILVSEGPLQVTTSRVTIPAGASLPVHKHPHQRYAYVLSGRLKVSNLETDTSVEYAPGDTVIEARGQWHTGKALGTEPVVLVVIDQTPPGDGNMVRKD